MQYIVILRLLHFKQPFLCLTIAIYVIREDQQRRVNDALVLPTALMAAWCLASQRKKNSKREEV